ncbi:MAG: 4-hydroxythreonine-4-phosphate dehydrogenase [Limisphaerales bacterium]|jgi:4-hydroxythreonine-4-phosphate dehydrogenase
MSEAKRPRLRVGITLGDYNGIGIEVMIKALQDNRILEFCTPVIYGSSRLIGFYKKNLGADSFNYHVVKKGESLNTKQVNVVNCWKEELPISVGNPTEASGEYAIKSLIATVEALERSEIDALLTLPIDKRNVQADRFSFPGHTEFFADRFQVRNSLMLMIDGDLRIGVVTNHIPLTKIGSTLSTELIWNKIRVLYRSLKNDFGIAKPRIAVLGLNPHASDGGLFGSEEEELILPAIQEAQAKNALVFGPFPADGFFGAGSYKSFDAVLAMYHDQGLIPFKTLSFSSGVNFTAGLPVIRTSPGHGTAFNIAGRNQANPDSFRAALFHAVDVARNRAAYGIAEPI